MNVENNRGAKFWFGIFMILFYLGFGFLFIKKYLRIANEGTSITVGIIFVIYGIWRAYRLYKEK